MTDSTVIEIALQTMLVALKLSAPILATSLVMGFALSRSLLGDLRLDEADKAAMFERLAELPQRCVDA